MVVVVSWVWPVLLHLGQDGLSSLMNNEFGIVPANSKEDVRTSVRELNLKRKGVMQQDNDPKHTSHSTNEWLKKNKVNVLEWPSQSPDPNPNEMLWKKLKQAVHRRKPSNITELKWF